MSWVSTNLKHSSCSRVLQNCQLTNLTTTVSPEETLSSGCCRHSPKFWPTPSGPAGNTVMAGEEESGGVGPGSSVSPWKHFPKDFHISGIVPFYLDHRGRQLFVFVYVEVESLRPKNSRRSFVALQLNTKNKQSVQKCLHSLGTPLELQCSWCSHYCVL
jgi:hypothetical protein